MQQASSGGALGERVSPKTAYLFQPVVINGFTVQVLVSSPGLAVLDSGCGKTIIGDRTLKQFQKLWQDDSRYSPKFKSETNVFKFGNGERETTTSTVIMPVGLAGRFGTVQAAVVQGDAPLLSRDRLQLFHGAIDLTLKSNAAGQYIIDVLDFPKNDTAIEANAVAAQEEPQDEVPMPAKVINPQRGPSDNPGNQCNPHEMVDRIKDDASMSGAPSREGVSCPCRPKPYHAVQGVSARKKQGGISKKQLRSLRKQVKEGVRSSKVRKKYAVVEVFCPPHFVSEVEKLGLKGLSFDTCTGWDLNEPKSQEWVLNELRDNPPELLVALR